MSRIKCVPCTLLAMLLAIGLVGDALRGADDAKPMRPLSLEAEISRGKEVSRLRLYLRNHTDRDISFPTGARGGPGSLNDEVLQRAEGERPRSVIGTAPSVLPVFYFKSGDGQIAMTPPTFSGPTNRAMRPAFAKIPAAARVLYASFAVPNAHVTDPFLWCELTLQGDADAPDADIVGRWEMRLTTNELRQAEP